MPDFMPHSRQPRRIFRVLLLAVLTAGISATPCRVAAQEPAPVVNSTAPAAASSETAKPESSEEAQTNAFRLEGLMVKWTAKTFHLSLEATATLFEFINFAIIFFGLGIPLFKFLPKFLRSRREKLSADLDSARKVSEEASARLSAIEAKLSGLDSEIAQIRAQVEQESKQDEARIKASIGEESSRIVAAAEQEIGSAAAQAQRTLRNFAADLAITQAAGQLTLTPENDRALIAEFLQDVTNHDGSGNGKGGQK